jgi:hypothetical protein
LFLKRFHGNGQEKNTKLNGGGKKKRKERKVALNEQNQSSPPTFL